MSPSDVYILPDDTTDQWNDESVIGEDTQLAGLYIVVDTRGEAFTSPAYGDVMKFSMAYESPADERYLYEDVASGMQPPPFDPTVEPDESVTFPVLRRERHNRYSKQHCGVHRAIHSIWANYR